MKNNFDELNQNNENNKYEQDYVISLDDTMQYIKISDNSVKDFETLLLFRCTEFEHAKNFLETGNIKFGQPLKWIEYYKTNGHGRGDLLEGVYASMKEFDERPIDFFKALRPNSKMNITEDGHCYFQSDDVLSMRTFCLFGLNDNMFPNQEVAEDKRVYPWGIISKEYFEDFYPDVTELNYDSLSDSKKPVLLMINNPHEFFKRIRRFLHNEGLNDNEFIIHPVGYMNKNETFLVGDGIPGELFNKDLSFCNQSEIRIVICSRRKEIIDKFDKTDGIFNIGSMKDIADIQEYYFKDFVFQRRGNELLFELPKPIIHEVTKEQAFAVIGQILCNRLPKDSIKGAYTKEEQLDLMTKLLKDEHNICFDRKTLTFYADDNYQPIDVDDWQRKWTLTGVEDILSGDGCVLYERGEFPAAIKNFTDAIDIDSSRADFWYNRGISFFMRKLFDNTLEDIDIAIKLNPTNEKYQLERERVLNIIKSNEWV